MIPTLDLRALAPAVAATRVWRTKGALWVTVIVKATFAFERDAAMGVTIPEPIDRAARHVGDDPMRSLARPSDVALKLPRPEVLLSGAAYVPPGTIGSVRLAVFGRSGAVVDKRLTVRADPDASGPLQRIPLCYEDAFGGPGHPDNPIGHGVKGDTRPRIGYPDEPTRTAGFGPIAPSWPVRRALFPKALRRHAGEAIVELPDELDFGFAQAAPADQQVDRIVGDEWIVLEGVGAEGPLRTRLPGVVARARVHTDGALTDRLDELRADRLLIDVERRRCSLTWRESFAMADAQALATCRISAGIELPNKPIIWPANASSMSATVAMSGESPFATTASLSMAEVARAVGEGALPFRSDRRTSTRASQPLSLSGGGAKVPTGTIAARPADLGVPITPFEAAPVDPSVSPWGNAERARAPYPRPASPPLFGPLAESKAVPTPAPQSVPAVPSETPEPPETPETPAPSEPVPLEPVPLEPVPASEPALRVARSTQPARVRARALAALLTTDDADLPWFATHKTRAKRGLDTADLMRIRDILEALSDVLDDSNAEEQRRIALAWELLRKDEINP